MSKYEPSPRFFPFAAPVEGELYLCGGRTDDFSERKKRPESITDLEIFDPQLETWRHVISKGHPPPLLFNGACVSSSHHLYSYGGYDGSSRDGSLHQLDTRTLTWTELSSSERPDGPRKKTGCRMVCYGHKLVLFGGRCDTTGPTQPGAGYVSKFRAIYTNELHTFDLNEGTWSSPTVSGTRPPPCCDFSFTMVDDHHAVLFGGYVPGQGMTNDGYILDFERMHWRKLVIQERGPFPVKRSYHTAVCLGYGGDNPQLLVIGGRDNLNDVWMLDVNSWRWREVSLPKSHQQERLGQCAAAFAMCPGLNEVVIFGGEEKTLFLPIRVSETCVLQFEYQESASTGEWVLTDVAGMSQLGMRERITEKNAKTSQITQKLASTPITQQSTEMVTKLEQRVREAEEHAREAERRMTEAEERSTIAERRLGEAERTSEERVGLLAEGRMVESERRAREAERRVEELERRLDESDRRLRESEERTREAERRFQQSEERVAECEDQLHRLDTQVLWTDQCASQTILDQCSDVASQTICSMETSVNNYLQGMDVMGSTSFLYCGKVISVTWKDHGFKLHLPENALPPDVTECSIRVRAALSGQFQFPDDAELVSGIYSIHSSHSFTQPVTVEIEHFSTIETLEEAEELSFVVSTGDQLPSQFRPLKNGIFPIHSRYGAIEVPHFCKYGVTRTRKSKQSARRELYKGYLLFNEANQSYDWEVIFSITPDTEIHSKSLLKKYPMNTVIEQPVVFKENKIQLKIPKEGLNLEGGWKIQPLAAPIILKSHVDTYRLHKQFSLCKFKVRYRGVASTGSDLTYSIDLLGAEEPYTYVMLCISSHVSPPVHFPSSSGNESGISPIASAANIGARRVPYPSYQTILATVDDAVLGIDDIGDVFDEVEDFSPNWNLLAIKLRLKNHTIEDIKKNCSDSKNSLSEALTEWLKMNYNHQKYGRPSWLRLAEAVRSLDYGLFEEIARKH